MQAGELDLSPLPDIGFVVLDGNGKLLNLLTSEAVDLPPGYEDASLRFDTHGFAVLQAIDEYTFAYELFGRRVHEAPGQELHAVDSFNDSTDALLLTWQARYPSLTLGGGEQAQIKQWLSSHSAPGTCCWWSLLSLAPLLRGQESSGSIRRYIANHWSQWLRYCEGVCPPWLAFRRGVDSNRRDRHWTRSLPAPTCSTLGLLVTMLSLGRWASEDSIARRAFGIGQSFCEHFLGDLDADLILSMSPRAHQHTWVGAALVGDDVVQLRMDNGCIDAPSLIGACSGMLRRDVATVAQRTLHRQGVTNTRKVPIFLFMYELLPSGCTSSWSCRWPP